MGKRRRSKRDSQRYATGEQRLEVLTRDLFHCRYCGVEVTMDSANIDHVKPWNRGGKTNPRNLVAACWQCNKKKGNRKWRPRPVWGHSSDGTPKKWLLRLIED